eukprot:4876068-Prymnesium_polylepis.3
MGRFARAGAPFRVPCDRVVCACRCPCALPAPLLRMWSCNSIRNGGSNRRARESDHARVVSDFVMRYSAAAGARGTRGDRIRSRSRLRSSARQSGDCPSIR